LTAPLTCFADPTTRSLSMISSSNSRVIEDIANGKSNLSKLAHSFCSARVRKWPKGEVPEYPLLGRYEVRSGHGAETAQKSKVILKRHRRPIDRPAILTCLRYREQAVAPDDGEVSYRGGCAIEIDPQHHRRAQQVSTAN
jgi:hypothetical protein